MGAKTRPSFWPLKHWKNLKVQIRDWLHGFNHNPIIRSHTEKNRPVNHLWHGTVSTNIQCYHSVIHILRGLRGRKKHEFGKGYMKLDCTLDNLWCVSCGTQRQGLLFSTSSIYSSMYLRVPPSPKAEDRRQLPARVAWVTDIVNTASSSSCTGEKVIATDETVNW